MEEKLPFEVEAPDDDNVGRIGNPDGDTAEARPRQHAPPKPSPEMVIGLLINAPPKSPGLRTLISPPAAVFEMAPAKVLHDAVRLQGLASSPMPETQVRVACARASVMRREVTDRNATMVRMTRAVLIVWISFAGSLGAGDPCATPWPD
jgi:hypothetical protein